MTIHRLLKNTTFRPVAEKQIIRLTTYFFTSGFVLVEALGNVGSDGRIVGGRERCAVLLLNFFALGIHRKIIRL